MTYPNLELVDSDRINKINASRVYAVSASDLMLVLAYRILQESRDVAVTSLNDAVDANINAVMDACMKSVEYTVDTATGSGIDAITNGDGLDEAVRATIKHLATVVPKSITGFRLVVDEGGVVVVNQ